MPHHRRTTRDLRPTPERFEEKNLPGAGLMGAPGHAIQIAGLSRAVPRFSPHLPSRLPQFQTYTLGPDSGQLVPPFGQIRADLTPLVPGSVYNLTFLTVRNGTSQTFNAASGFTVQLPGQGGFQPFLQGKSQWKPGGVIVFYVLSTSQFPGSFSFKFNGPAQEKPNNISYNIQYNPTTFPGTLNAIVAQSVGARYRLVG
jgi:hypothetical protein